MKTIINKSNSNWTDIKNKCRTTVGKEYTENKPSSSFKSQLLISEHSPIRLLTIDWSWKNIKSWISIHFSRHKWECFISSQRTDRTGNNRDNLKQSELVNFDGMANAQHLIDTSRKRLCYQASKETREYWEDLKCAIYNNGERELANVLVPNCIYRMGCPEFKGCNFFNKFCHSINFNDSQNINSRYELYNLDFYKAHNIDIKDVNK